MRSTCRVTEMRFGDEELRYLEMIGVSPGAAAFPRTVSLRRRDRRDRGGNRRIAGAEGTSNVGAAIHYGMRPVGTMVRSYVKAFADEQEAFRTFMEDTPENAIMLVDTYDTLEGVRHAIAASRQTGVNLKGVRLDSGDLLSLSRSARALLGEADMRDAQIVASGDLEEHQIAKLVAAGAPIDIWGVGTELGTSRDAPALGGVSRRAQDGPGGRRAQPRRPGGTSPRPGLAGVRSVSRPVLGSDCYVLSP